MSRRRRRTASRRPLPLAPRLRALAGLGLALALGMGLAAAVARAEGPNSLSSGTQDLDEVEQEQPTSLDDVGRESPTSLRGVGRKSPTSLDVEGRTEELNRLRDAPVDSIEDVNQAAGPWRPPPCDLALPPGADVPESDDVDLWRQILEDARVRLEETRTRMQRAERGFVSLNTDPRRESEASDARDALERARQEYAEARCALPALLEAARRAGVPPGTLREVRQQLPADLGPAESRY